MIEAIKNLSDDYNVICQLICDFINYERIYDYNQDVLGVIQYEFEYSEDTEDFVILALVYQNNQINQVIIQDINALGRFIEDSNTYKATKELVNNVLNNNKINFN